MNSKKEILTAVVIIICMLLFVAFFINLYMVEKNFQEKLNNINVCEESNKFIYNCMEIYPQENCYNQLNYLKIKQNCVECN